MHSSYIKMNSNRDNRLTIAKSTVTGNCDDLGTQRVPVTFGEDLRSGCQLV